MRETFKERETCEEILGKNVLVLGEERKLREGYMEIIRKTGGRALTNFILNNV